MQEPKEKQKEKRRKIPLWFPWFILQKSGPPPASEQGELSPSLG